jgi:hypothetical protein
MIDARRNFLKSLLLIPGVAAVLPMRAQDEPGVHLALALVTHCDMVGFQASCVEDAMFLKYHLPGNVFIIRKDYDPRLAGFVVTLSHPSFPAVVKGCQVPFLTPVQ